jgi:hypothetical protein
MQIGLASATLVGLAAEAQCGRDADPLIGGTGMPTASSRWRVLVAVAAGALSCGIPLWPIPYERVSMPSHPSASVWLLGGAVSGALAAALLRPGFRTPTLAVGLGFVLAVVGRVWVETARDPTSHNLWPFEVVIAGSIGLAGGLLGTLVTRAVERFGRSSASRGGGRSRG